MRDFIAALAVALGLCTSAIGVERAIDKEVLVDASVEQVWDAWITKSGITSFFAPDAEIDARVGDATRDES